MDGGIVARVPFTPAINNFAPLYSQLTVQIVIADVKIAYERKS